MREPFYTTFTSQLVITVLVNMCIIEQIPLKSNLQFTQSKAIVVFDLVDKDRQTCVNFTE